jgi:hypothetical protein
MLSPARRYLLVILLLVVGVGAALALRFLPRRAVTAEAVSTPPAGAPAASAAPLRTYFVDVEGWYRITPFEAAVRSPYDLSGGTNETIGAALPASIGDWTSSGRDFDLRKDAGVQKFLADPPVAMQRDYSDASGQRLAFVIIGNKGDDSYLLFSHTPEICYPSSQWKVLVNEQASANLDTRPMYAHYLLTEYKASGQQMASLYWYLWTAPERDSKEGVLSMRVNVYLLKDQSAEEAAQRAWDFVRLLFPSTLNWKRF